MRIKVLIVVVGVAVLACLVPVLFRRPQPSNSPVASEVEQHPALLASAQPRGVGELASHAPAPGVSTNASEGSSTDEVDEQYVDERIAQLSDLGMNDDTDSLNTILSELNNRDPRIRKAALDATVQFGSRDAIPKLMDAITQTDDPREQVAILDAIEFLKLPSITEVRAQQGQQGSSPKAPQRRLQ